MADKLCRSSPASPPVRGHTRGGAGAAGHAVAGAYDYDPDALAAVLDGADAATAAACPDDRAPCADTGRTSLRRCSALDAVRRPFRQARPRRASYAARATRRPRARRDIRRGTPCSTSCTSPRPRSSPRAVNAEATPDVRGLDRRPGRVLGRAGQAARLDQALHPGEEHLVRLPQRLDQVVRGRQAQRRGQLHRPPPRHPRRPDRDHLGERRPGRLARTSATASCTREVSKFANVLHALGVGEGRPGRPLPADDPRGRLRHARLRPHRRGALGGLRRLLRRGAALAHRGLGREARRSPPTRRRAAAAAPRSRPTPTRRSPASPACASWWSPHRRRGALGRRPRRLAARGDGPRLRPTARRWRWAPRTRSSSSTPPARPASPRAWCTPPAAISSTPR